MESLLPILDAITPVDRSLEAKIRAHLDNLTKPVGSLGFLEDLAANYCLMTGNITPQLGKKRIVTFVGDHAVAAEGVSAYPSEVTPQMVYNMLAGGAAINVLTKHIGADLQVVDIGVANPLEGASGLLRRKVKAGTDNMSRGPAMTQEEAIQAILVGVELAHAAADDGVTLLGTGEMGIANTTPSSALYASLIPCPVIEVTGRGTGIDNTRLRHKIKVIERSLEVNANLLSDPLSTLAAVGGLEIAGICGLILAAAAKKLPVVVDGFISSAAALVAMRLSESVLDYLFFSHCSAEAGHRTFFERLGIRPILDLDLRLGEGTGAALAMHVIEGAVKIYNEMATFDSAGVSGKDN
ncbi:MAG: nicotinate-nucleotide--dimethylbenzimidazole phosphoribosyltransferase [Deltaproteobacteria bacterium]|nr:MAG: nicotinate-nucleotide--dimethylbenzimidazole phosphoribosyltransferase [Deltaproteobacteria bacterium]